MKPKGGSFPRLFKKIGGKGGKSAGNEVFDFGLVRVSSGRGPDGVRGLSGLCPPFVRGLSAFCKFRRIKRKEREDHKGAEGDQN